MRVDFFQNRREWSSGKAGDTPKTARYIDIHKNGGTSSWANNEDVLNFPRSVMKQAGFNLPSLITTLATISVLISLAAPAFYYFIQQIRLTNAVNALHHAINLTRMEAIKRNGRVDLIANNGSWKNGWTIVADNQVIFTHEVLHDDIRVDSTFPNKTKSLIAYNGTGRPRTDNNSYSSLFGTIRLSIGTSSRLITMNFLGRVRVCNPATAPAKTCVSAALRK